VVLVWLLFAPVQLQIDTRIPEVYFRWITVGKAKLIYEQDKWWLRISVFVFSKEWDFAKLTHRKKKRVRKARPKRRTKKANWLMRLLNVGKSFRITRWQISIDSGDDIKNAWMYPLNFHPAFRRHLNVNFFDENYLFLEIRNAPWKIIYALMK
jgi:hypothetical protein